LKLHFHQTHTQIADFESCFELIKTHAQTPGLHLYPELFLSGYPLQDLCLQKPFISAYQNFLDRLNAWAQNDFKSKDTLLLVGGLEYEFDDQGLPYHLKNVIYHLSPGEKLEAVYTKQLLPNYDIFDEKKYFIPGNQPKVLNFQGKSIGLLICEDMWPSSLHDTDPTVQLKEYTDTEQINLDLIVNLSASPFHLGKQQKRIQRASEISNYCQTPFAYLNRVGGEDEILFDGSSFLISGDKVLFQAASFMTQDKELDFPAAPTSSNEKTSQDKPSSWEGLFEATLDHAQNPPKLSSYNDEELESLLQALVFGFQEYAKRTKHSKFVVALSGGMDSGLVLTLLKLGLLPEQELEAVFMPGLFSNSLSYDISRELCQTLGVKLTTMPIKFLHTTSRNLYLQSFGHALEGLADENIQSRLRGTLIYARANDLGALVINTSNKSEMAVGYSTLYGDSIGAISLLGDLYKTEVYDLAQYINRRLGQEVISKSLMERPPSAELRPDQRDDQSLPPYEILDAILEATLSNRFDQKDLLELGFESDHIEKTLNLYRHTEFKRAQSCPIIKVKPKSFGFGYRIPITKKSDFYLNK